MTRAVTPIQNGSIRTLCRMCDTRCSIAVRIKNGYMVDILPAGGNPVNNGRICPRAGAAIDMFYHRDRVLTPLKRLPDGSWQPIERERALDEIAGRMEAVQKRYGASALGVWKGEAVGFWQQEEYARRFIQACGSPNYFSNDSACFNGRFLGHYLVTGFWNPFPDFTHARLIMLFGTNPPVCHPPFMADFADARARGAHLVVVDPRLNPIACHADIFAQPIPGTDGALAWGLIRLVIARGGCDLEFVAKYTVGFDQIAAYAQRFTPAYVENQTGIYADVVVAIAELIINNRPDIGLYMGAGLEHHENGVNNIRALAILSCLCGALDLACGLAWPEPMPRRRLCPTRMLPGGIGSKRFPVLHEISRECHSMTAMDNMLGHDDPPLKAIIMSGANPAVTHPNLEKTKKALAALDLLVVNDLFVTPTAQLAHYVLPAATFLERSELHINTRLQRVYLTTQIAKIPGVETDYCMWRDLACRLGFGDVWFPWKEESAVNRYILAPSGITINQLQQHPEGICYQPQRFQKYLTQPLPTPSGKVELASAYLKQLGLDEIPRYQPPYHLRRSQTDYPLLLTTGARKTLFYHSRHQNIARFRKVHPRAEVEIHPDDAARLGIAQGQSVRIVSEVGSLVVAAKIVHRAELRPGVIEMYHGWQDWPINQVTLDYINDPISGFPLLKAVPVRIETAWE